MPVSLTAALQFLPMAHARVHRVPLVGRRSDGRSRRRAGLAQGLLSGRPWTSGNPHAHSGAQATAADRGAHARAGRARARGGTRSSRPPIASGAAKTMMLRWYAPCSVNDEPPVGCGGMLGGAMTQGMKRSRQYIRRLPILALVLGLPAFSMTSELAVEPPAPSVLQCALIEVHDTAGIGWWSSAALEIDPVTAVNSGE